MFFSNAHGTFSRLYHLLGHETRVLIDFKILKKYKMSFSSSGQLYEENWKIHRYLEI